MTYSVCACGHRDTEHVSIGCMVCACDLYEPELRVTSDAVPYDWSLAGEL